jgi:hypothetical protein
MRSIADEAAASIPLLPPIRRRPLREASRFLRSSSTLPATADPLRIASSTARSTA